MCLDVEHFSKVRLMKALEESDGNGYDIVESFKSELKSKKQLKFLEDEMDRNKKNPYCGDLLKKHIGNFPIWAFIEIIPFGRYIHFYLYCAKHLSSEPNNKMVDEYYLLLKIKELRNAAAHSNCILNDLHPRHTDKDNTPYAVSRALSKIDKVITKDIRKRKMSNLRIQQIVTLMYAHKLLVTSKGVQENQSIVLNELAIRMIRNRNYYTNNEMILTTFDFLETIIDTWFPMAYNDNT